MFRTLPGGGSPGGENTGRSRGRTTTAHQTGLLTEISLLPSLVQTRHHFPGSPFTAMMHRLPGAAERGPRSTQAVGKPGVEPLSPTDSPFPVPVGWDSSYLLLQNRNDQPGSLAPHLKA